MSRLVKRRAIGHLAPAGNYLGGVNDDRVARLVAPFYLKMMRLNAIEYGEDLAPAIVRAGRDAGTDDIVALLRDPWRSTVMGAWLSIVRGADGSCREVLSALGRSHGSLDAPPLAIAAVVLADDRALPALSAYVERDRQAGWGAARFVTAIIRHLGASRDGHASATEDTQVRAMFEVAELLRRGDGSPS